MKTLKQIREIFSMAQMKKAIGIARGSKGQYTKAYNAIEKIKKGLGDEHIIANALKKANEDLEEAVAVDCRTKGYKKAAARAEARKTKREGNSDIDEIISRTNKALFGEDMTASGSDATGNIEYAEKPLGKVHKKKKK